MSKQAKRIETVPDVNAAPFVCIHCHNTSFNPEKTIALPGLVVWMCDLCHVQTFGHFLDDGSVVYAGQQSLPVIEDYARLGVVVRKRP